MFDPDKREDAWRTFSRRYGPLISRWCRQRGVPPRDRDEVRAAVVLGLFKTIESYDPTKGRFRPWLATVVYNAVRDRRRHLQRHPDHQPRGGSDLLEVLAGVEAPDATENLARELDELLEPEAAARFADVRQRVDVKTWRAFWLRCYHGLSAREVAEELKPMTETAVSQAVYRVKKMIREDHDQRCQESG